MGGLFSGSKEPDKQYNQAYGGLNAAFSPLYKNAASGANALQALLSGDTSGFDTFKKSTGFDATAEAGSRGITGNAAAAGLLRSGGTAKALQSFGDTIQNQYANNYMDRLLSQANIGFNAGNLVSGAGGVKNSSQGKPGLGDVLMGGLSAFAL